MVAEKFGAWLARKIENAPTEVALRAHAALACAANPDDLTFYEFWQHRKMNHSEVHGTWAYAGVVEIGRLYYKECGFL